MINIGIFIDYKMTRKQTIIGRIMGTLEPIFDYFWPKTPMPISDESKNALKEDLKESKGFFDDVSSYNQDRLSPWIRMSDRNARSENREWLSIYAMTFFKRWLFLSLLLICIALLCEGIYIIEVPVTLSAFVTLIVTFSFLYAHRVLNK
jgi:hypothetical protein